MQSGLLETLRALHDHRVDVEVTVDQRAFFVASIDDLIAMKQRAGRPRDLLDIAELRDIQERLH